MGAVPSAPTGQVSFAANRSVVNTTDAIIQLAEGAAAFNGLNGPGLRIIKTPGGVGTNVIYLHAVPPESNEIASGNRVNKIAIGPLELATAVNLASQGLVFQAFLNLPIYGGVLVSSAAGDLQKGITLPLAYPSIISGSITLSVRPGADNHRVVHLQWGFTAMGQEYQNAADVFDLDYLPTPKTQ